jgi:hypothetical protein
VRQRIHTKRRVVGSWLKTDRCSPSGTAIK